MKTLLICPSCFRSIYYPKPMSTLHVMALCPLHHRNFDQIYNPGFVFVPTDFAYFIAFENKDCEKRSRLARDAMIKNAIRRG
jgi:hypothetical protein